MRGGLVGRGPAEAGFDWHAIRSIVAMALVLVAAGAMLGVAVGYALSWLVTATLDGLGF